MAYTLSPWPKAAFFTDAGAPAASYLLFTYEAGTSTPKTTYSDDSETSPVANANPIVLDSAGRCNIFLAPGSYKFALCLPSDSGGASPIWSQDDIQSVPQTYVNLDIPGDAGQVVSDRQLVYLSDGTSALNPGSWYKADADAVYSSTEAPHIGFALNGAVQGGDLNVRVGGRVDRLSGLVAGSTYYVSATLGEITATAPSNPRVVGIADTTTSLVLGPGKPTHSRRVKSVTATVGNVGAGEDTLATYTAPAGELSATDMRYSGKFWGLTANNANAKTIRIRLIEGANNTVLMQFASTASELGEWVMEFDIVRTATTTGRTNAWITVGPANGPVSRSGTLVATPTATWANACEIRLTGDATTDNDITVQGGYITLNP